MDSKKVIQIYILFFVFHTTKRIYTGTVKVTYNNVIL